MATNSVNIVILAKDNATIHFNKAEKSVKKFGNSLNDVMKMTAAYFSIRYLSQFTKELVMAASDATEVKNKFKEVFKEQTKNAVDFVNTTSKELGRSKIDLMEWSSNFQDVFVPLGFARQEARLMSQEMVKLSVDLASFKNKLEPEVMRDLQSAVVGNYGAIRKYGLIITETKLKQELLNMGVKKGITGATEQQKVLARLNIIISNTKDAQGDATRTAKDFANQLKRLQGNTREMSAAAGQVLIPTLSSLIDVFNNNIVSIIKSTTRMIGWSAGVFTAVKIIPKLVSGIATITRIIKGLIASQITLQSLMGPLGWGNIAAGLAVAIGFIGTTEYILGKFDDNLNAAVVSLDNASEASGNAKLNIQELTDSFAKAGTVMDNLPINWQTTLLERNTLTLDEQYQSILSVSSAYQSLDESVRQLILGEDQYLIAKAKSLGFDSYSIQSLKELMQLRDKYKKQQDGENAYLEASLELKKQIATVGMNEQQKLLFDLNNLGLSKDKIEVIKGLQEELRQTTKEFNSGKLLVKNSLSAYETRFLSGVTIQRNYQQEQSRESKKQTPLLKQISDGINKMASKQNNGTVTISNFS